MEIIITIVICITVLAIVGLLCYTKYKINGIDYFRKSYEKIDKVVKELDIIKSKISEIEFTVNTIKNKTYKYGNNI